MTHSQTTQTVRGGETARGVKTDGLGKATTRHLNLTKSLAQVILERRDFMRIAPSPKRKKK